MKIALLGYGKMGKVIERLAEDRGDTVVAKVGHRRNSEELPIEQISQADVCIDFSHPSAVIEHIRAASAAGRPLVIGTTGWEMYLEEAKSIISRGGIGCLYAPNFSVGVQMFLALVERAAKLFAAFEQYDVAGYEIHHRQKADSPSGTAKLIAEILMRYITRKQSISWDRIDGAIDPATLHFPSLRLGSNPGTHTVVFDSLFDTITIKHEARGREGFAQGALDAARWIEDKKGFYTLEEMLANIAATPQPGAPT